MILTLILTAGCIEENKSSIPDKSVYYKTSYGNVTRIIDGDTLELSKGNKIRLLGINTPERGRYLYDEAKERLEELVLGKNVTLKSDFEHTDRYGRNLSYVFIDDIHINTLILKEGLAVSYIVEPNDRYSEEIVSAEEYAMDSGSGLWERSEYYDCFSISEFVYDVEGDDRNEPNNEYLRLQYNCDTPLNMDSWTIKDDSSKIFIFNDFSVRNKEEFTLFSGAGKSTGKNMFWYAEDKKGVPVWNNNHDSIFLRDNKGKLVFFYRYENKQ